MILIVGVLVIILMGLFPPWTMPGSRGNSPLGYAFIGAPPDKVMGVDGYMYPIRALHLDISRLCVQWIVVIFATGLGVFLSAKWKK
jgi:hypothetical protein